MKALRNVFVRGGALAAGCCLVFAVSIARGHHAFTTDPAKHLDGMSSNDSEQKAITMKHASGTFDVKLSPMDDKSEDATLARMSIEKQWHGDIEGTSKGQMLTAGTAVKNSAGYVAIEKVAGAIAGRKGTFVFQRCVQLIF